MTMFVMIAVLLASSTYFVRTANAAMEDWLWPVKASYRKVSRGFYPNGKHNAIDIPVSVGNDIYASKDGIVITVFNGCNQSFITGSYTTSCTKSTCSPTATYYDPKSKKTSTNNGSFTTFSGSYKNSSGKEIKYSYARCNSGYGRGVILYHSDGTVSSYAHMDSVSVSVGQKVNKGDVIGKSGARGNAFGAHVHFQIGKYNALKSYTWINNNPKSADLHITLTSSITTGLAKNSNGYVYNTSGVNYCFDKREWNAIGSKTLTFTVKENGSNSLLERESPYGDSTVMKTHKAGDTIVVKQAGTNVHGNVWYKTSDGFYIYDNILDYACAKSEVKSTKTVDLTLTVMENGTSPLYENRVPFGFWIKPVEHKVGDQVHATLELVNSAGSTWYRLDNGRYMWKGVLSASAVTEIDAPEEMTVCIGEPTAIPYSILPSGSANVDVTFASSDSEICYVDANGTLMAKRLSDNPYDTSVVVTIQAGEDVSAMVLVHIEHNITSEQFSFDGKPLAQPWQIIVVNSNEDIPYQYHYTLSNDTDPGYEARFECDWSGPNLSWTVDKVQHTVRFNGYGQMGAAWYTPAYDYTLGDILVIDPSRSIHIPSGTKVINSESFAGTNGLFFYLPSSVHTLSANAFPENSVIFLNTGNLESFVSDGKQRMWIETGPSFNAQFEAELGQHPSTIWEYSYWYRMPAGVTGYSVPDLWWYDWSDWTDLPYENNDDIIVESKTQYRSAPITVSSGLGEWSDWSKWSSTQLTISDSELMQEEKRTLYQYYYFECSSCGAHMPYSTKCLTDLGGCGKTNSQVTFSWNQGVWLTTSKSGCTAYGSKYWTTSGGKKVYLYSDADSPTLLQYRYRTREYEERKIIGEYSEWTDTFISQSENLAVESRTLYRYKRRYRSSGTY